jgi:hypothetical protein
MQLTPKQERKLQRIVKVMEEGNLALVEQLFEIEEKFEQALTSLETNIINTLKDLKGKDAVVDYDRVIEEVSKLIPPPQKGDKGDKYVPTKSDLKKIAKMVKTPVVEKVIEIIKEPVVTEVVKEVALKDSADEIIEKINASEKTISAEKIEGLKNHDEEIATLQNRTQLLLQIATQRNNSSSSPSSSASGGATVETPPETPDGVVTAFTVSDEPQYVVADGATFFDGAGYTYSALTITMDNPVTQYIRIFI